MTTETDWETLNTTINVAGIDYHVEAAVFIRIERSSQSLEHFGTPCREESADVSATLEGWVSLPECPKNREAELEQRLLEEIDQREW